jgi:hypothetical protein
VGSFNSGKGGARHKFLSDRVQRLNFELSSTFVFIAGSSPTTQTAVAKMPSTNNKDKPWDTDDIDKWKVGFEQTI